MKPLGFGGILVRGVLAGSLAPEICIVSVLVASCLRNIYPQGGLVTTQGTAS